MGLSPAIGGYVMSTLVAGRVARGGAGSNNDCDAGARVRTAWVFNAFAVVVATDDVWPRDDGRGRDGSDHVAWRAELKAPAPWVGQGAGWDFYASARHFVSFASHRLRFRRLVPTSSATPKSVTSRPIKSRESFANSKTALGHELMNQKISLVRPSEPVILT